MKKLKNWDNQTWLSSKSYINQFNKFLNKRVRFNKNMKILKENLRIKFGKSINNFKTVHGTYKEYHNSLDNKKFMKKYPKWKQKFNIRRIILDLIYN